jgi:hypothetical protein
VDRIRPAAGGDRSCSLLGLCQGQGRCTDVAPCRRHHVRRTRDSTSCAGEVQARYTRPDRQAARTARLTRTSRTPIEYQTIGISRTAPDTQFDEFPSVPEVAGSPSAAPAHRRTPRITVDRPICRRSCAAPGISPSRSIYHIHRICGLRGDLGRALGVARVYRLSRRAYAVDRRLVACPSRTRSRAGPATVVPTVAMYPLIESVEQFRVSIGATL